MPRPKLPDHLTAIALLVCVVAGCKQMQRFGQPTVLKSSDGKFQLTVPVGWKTDLSLNDRAGIQAAYPRAELYIIVITDDKSDCTDEMTLEQFTDISIDSMTSNVESPDSTPPLPVKINGNAGRQYMLQGAVKNVKVTYLITTVETPAHFHQIITWTLTSRISQNQVALQAVSETFRPATAGTDGSAPMKQRSERPAKRFYVSCRFV